MDFDILAQTLEFLSKSLLQIKWNLRKLLYSRSLFQCSLSALLEGFRFFGIHTE